MIRHGVFALLVAGVGYACIQFGGWSARALERLLIDRAENGLAVLELDWAYVRADGLRLELHGHAPDGFARDLALESVRATAPLAVVIDHSSVNLAPPPRRDLVRVEMLRDDTGLTLTGSFHSEPVRASLIAALSTAAPGLALHDLTGVNAAHPGPGWGPELEIATLAAVRVGNAYVRIEPGEVRITGLVRDADHRRAVSSVALLALAGDRVNLTLRLREPLRVAAPFAFAAAKQPPGGIRLEACAARDADEAAALETALKRFGVDPAEVSCPAALGGPSGDWAAAVTAGLQALDRLPAGRFRLEYYAADLQSAPETRTTETGMTEIGAARGELAAALPKGYRLLPDRRIGAALPADPQPYWMRIRKTREHVELSGVSPDPTARRLVETYAATRFGRAALRSALTIGGSGLPPQWEAAALAAFDALETVSEGVAELSPGRIAIRAMVPDPREAARLHRQLAETAPEGYSAQTALTVDLPAQMTAVPLTPARCVAVLNAAVEAQPISFAPGSAVFEAGSRATLQRLGEILGRCEPGTIEIGGHTDSQGSTGLNERLSRARAEAVPDALLALGVSLDSLRARGYGETTPVASNETEAGRALNRRIEFADVESPARQEAARAESAAE